MEGKVLGQYRVDVASRIPRFHVQIALVQERLFENRKDRKEKE